jgi:hypothetical protein
MLRGMSFKEFREWIAFADLEPFDETRQDYRIASVVATLINVNRGKGKRAVTVDEVRLMFGDQKKERKQTPMQQMQIAMLAAAAYNHSEEEKELKRKNANDRRESRNSLRKASSRG